MPTRLWGKPRFTRCGAFPNIQVLAKKDDLDLEALPSDALHRELAAVGIERARHRMADLVALVGSQTASEKARRSIASLADRQHSGDQLEVVDDDGACDGEVWSREEERACA